VLSEGAYRVFGQIAAGEPVSDEDADFVAELEHLGYVRLDEGRENRPVALDPVEVGRRRLEDALTEAETRIRQMSNLPGQTDRLAAIYQRAQAQSGGGSEYYDDPAVVNARLDDLIASARVEILAAQPGGPRTREQLQRSWERDQAALARGVRMRTLYLDSVRQSGAMAEHVRTMTGHGGEYRTLHDPFERCIIVDRRHAFISDHVHDGDGDWGGEGVSRAAWYVTDRPVVAFLASAFADAWGRAQPWQGELRSARAAWGAARGVGCVDAVSGPDAGVRTTPLERAVLRDMVASIDQRGTAARLGISHRKLTDVIAGLKGKFGAASLPELAYRWAKSPDALINDNAPDGGSGAGRSGVPAA
jgi:hypothetical protein